MYRILGFTFLKTSSMWCRCRYEFAPRDTRNDRCPFRDTNTNDIPVGWLSFLKRIGMTLFFCKSWRYMSPKSSFPITPHCAAFPPNFDSVTATFPIPPGDIDMYLELTVPPDTIGLRVFCSIT